MKSKSCQHRARADSLAPGRRPREHTEVRSHPDPSHSMSSAPRSKKLIRAKPKP